ncbi:hypothetical protein U1Q18_004818 [Sarracenia purpurea var. burkii]
MRILAPVDNGTAPAPVFPPQLPSPSPFYNFHGSEILLFPAIPIVDSVFDIATLSLICCLVLLSILSVSFILQLRLKSRRSQHLHRFNCLWTVRVLLVSFIALWALNEILRLPSFHRHYLYPFLPYLTLSEQANLCKLHVVLSIGFFEPGFLITLLFLVNVSIKKRNPSDIWALGFIFLACLPVLVLQMFFVFFSPLQAHLPDVFQASSVLSIDPFDNETQMCTYPLFSILVFAAFGILYSLGFLFTYWRVVSLVINKGTRVRIHALALSVLVSLPTQVFFMALSSFWIPENAVHYGVMLGMFVTVALCAAVGEVILVIRPIADALSAGGDSCSWKAPAEVGWQEVVVDQDGNQ